MSQTDVVRFFIAARDDPALLVRYDRRHLSELLFQAKNDGFNFTPEELADVAGKLEASVILAKDRGPFDGSSALWRHMWGKRHLGYLIESVIRRHDDEELWAIIGQTGQ